MRRAAIALLVVLLFGCASQPKQTLAPPEYPPPPAEPRFIYDGTLRSNKDIETITLGDRLQSFATGADVRAQGLAKPYGVAVRNGRVYVTDTQQRAVVLFDIPDRSYKLFGTDGPGSLLKPLGIDISGRGEVFVVDNTARRIVVYDADGNFLRAFGDPKQLVRPSSVALSPDDRRAYVVDTGGVDSEHHRILVYDADSGELLDTIGRRGSNPGELNLPLQAATGPDGNIFVVDGGNFRVQTFSPDGEPLNTFGRPGRRSGQFARPKGIAVDAEGHVYVADTAFGNVQIFDRDGTLLLHIGERSTSGGPGRYMLPADVAVDAMGRLYIVDQFFRKVDVIRPVDAPSLGALPKQ